MITVAQDQAVSIEVYNVNVLHYSNDPICPMCYASDEAIFYVFSACSTLVSSKYLEQNNSTTAFLIYKHVCEYHDIPSITHNHVV